METARAAAVVERVVVRRGDGVVESKGSRGGEFMSGGLEGRRRGGRGHALLSCDVFGRVGLVGLRCRLVHVLEIERGKRLASRSLEIGTARGQVPGLGSICRQKPADIGIRGKRELSGPCGANCVIVEGRAGVFRVEHATQGGRALVRGSRVLVRRCRGRF